jgi:hypothetical protein
MSLKQYRIGVTRWWSNNSLSCGSIGSTVHIHEVGREKVGMLVNRRAGGEVVRHLFEVPPRHRRHQKTDVAWSSHLVSPNPRTRHTQSLGDSRTSSRHWSASVELDLAGSSKKQILPKPIWQR